MSTYFIGDIHGCYDELIALLKQVNFSPVQDTLWLTGDLVSRGPNSLEVLLYIKSLGNCVRLVLGNHDLYLLAVYAGICHNHPQHQLTTLLRSPKVHELLYWLRHQHLLQVDKEKNIIMVHAGIYPQWDLQTAKKYARDVENALVNNNYSSFLNTIYYNMINAWSAKLNKIEQQCFIVNSFTRMRYCDQNGKLNMFKKDAPKNDSTLLQPWFTFPSKVRLKYNVVFGHWASLQGKKTPKRVYALDTGCCWGGKLTCLRWEDKQYFVQPSYQKNKE